ncbi:hypothetical protein IV203_027814 [Nitzschia inconspicua]|uniref:Uncharacterized protein n=1 Tax=Nitzschia inconspicua TaxID=303405 RepID=A0A9K3LXZ8_9STRA|nr:hypothetical protein IV203_027814 [Nitzschia inconspicua]
MKSRSKNHGFFERRSKEAITSLRWRDDCDRNENDNIGNSAPVVSTTNSTPTKSALRNHSALTRYCPAGHVLANNVPLLQRQEYLQQLQKLGTSILPSVGCDACSKDIEEDRIGATCTVCDIDFCQACYHDSGKSVEDLLSQAKVECCPMSSAASVEGSLRSFNSTQEFCAAGHELVEIATLVRQRYLQDRDQLDILPIIECDCCSKEIRDDIIAGCDTECDIDICKDCFKNGQSYENVLEERRPENMREHELSCNTHYQQRYNGRRPTYRGTGRVSYDEYPDPTAFQWKFTGSSKSKPVEYFEKDFGPEVGVVLLDMYYTTGTVKTVLIHSNCGARIEQRVLFSNDQPTISTQSFRKILKDPCSHNNRRYKPVGKTSSKLLL